MSSPRFIPMPLSATVRVRADLSGIRMTEKLASPSANSGSVSAAYRSRSQASEAFEISSRRKISFSLYSECATISSRRLTSAWKLLVSWVMVAVASWRDAPRICAENLSRARPSATDRTTPLSDTASPTLDGALDERAVALLRPGARERRGGAFWAPSFRRQCKAYPHRHRHPFTDGD